MYDIVIIGAGVCGCSIARELARYKCKTVVIDKASDICEGTSKANSGIVHAGFDAKPGSMKAKLNVLGNKMMKELATELDFDYKQNGSLVLCFSELEVSQLQVLLEQGVQNGVPNLRIINQDELRKMEPNVSPNAYAALYAPSAGIVCPFNITIAMAENAYVNGTEFLLDTEVVEITRDEESYKVITTKGTYEGKIVINAAGVYADVFHNMVSMNKINITPRKGEYCLLDKKVGDYVNKTLFQLPNQYGKGVLVTPTVHGNLLIGPSATDIDDKEGIQTTAECMEKVLNQASNSLKELPRRQIITSFAGLRAREDHGDFIIQELEDAKGFIDVAGIESPGLTCAPAIGQYVAEIVHNIIKLEEKNNYVAIRNGIRHMQTATLEQREAMIRENSAYANVICRCELVTEGEIVDAINRPLGAKTIDGVKRRTRAGMGRCQAGFCSPKTLEILARELGVSVDEITKCGGESKYIMGINKEDI